MGNGPERPCKVCGCIFSHGNLTYTTCGSPRCRTEARRMTYREGSQRAAEKRKEQRAETRAWRPRRIDAVVADETARRRVATAYQRALDAGFTGMEAAREAAIKTGESVASVLSIWKSVNAA